ncbi:MAG: hypothetical protein P4L69_19725 [Desulfosporosinus sp.]|nr:hypothetical protein [Desulfosporosinus sp.]
MSVQKYLRPSQQWKAPVSTWIREMYQERQEKARRKKERKEISAE